MSPEARFERELEQLRRDSNAATQFLYGFLFTPVQVEAPRYFEALIARHYSGTHA
jgi:hypothetical protein